MTAARGRRDLQRQPGAGREKILNKVTGGCGQKREDPLLWQMMSLTEEVRCGGKGQGLSLRRVGLFRGSEGNQRGRRGRRNVKMKRETSRGRREVRKLLAVHIQGEMMKSEEEW